MAKTTNPANPRTRRHEGTKELWISFRLNPKARIYRREEDGSLNSRLNVQPSWHRAIVIVITAGRSADSYASTPLLASHPPSTTIVCPVM